MHPFSCYQCGQCCQVPNIPIFEWEWLAIENWLQVNSFPVEITIEREIIEYEGKGIIAETILNGPHGICPFLQGTLCLIYQIRPNICRAFPLQKNPDKMFELFNDFHFAKSSCNAKIFHDLNPELLQFKNIKRLEVQTAIKDYLNLYSSEIQEAAQIRTKLNMLKDTAKQVLLSSGGRKMMQTPTSEIPLISIFKYIQDMGFLPKNFFHLVKTNTLTANHLLAQPNWEKN